MDENSAKMRRYRIILCARGEGRRSAYERTLCNSQERYCKFMEFATRRTSSRNLRKTRGGDCGNERGKSVYSLRRTATV